MILRATVQRNFQTITCSQLKQVTVQKSIAELWTAVSNQMIRYQLTHTRLDQIHGFTISFSVLILPWFWQMLLRNWKISSKSLFWMWKQRANSRWQQQSYFTSILNNFSSRNFQIGIIFDPAVHNHKIKHYLNIIRENFMKMQNGYYR